MRDASVIWEPTEGIVLRTFPYRESDLILRVITRTYAKVSLLAKHARSSKKRFPGSLDLFDRGTFEISRGRGELFVVGSFTSFGALGGLRSDLNKFACGSALCESVDLLFKEDTDSSEAPYEILNLALNAIDHANSIGEMLKATHHALSLFLEVSGFYRNDGKQKASAKGLLELVEVVQNSAEKKLVTQGLLVSIIERLRKSKETPSIALPAKNVAD